MIEEKKYLVDEVSGHLAKSDYVFLVDYKYVTVPEVANLRKSLKGHNAEFHVVKNSALRYAAKEHNLPDLESALGGPTAIIMGGDSPSEVAKIVVKFYKDNNDKCEVKIGVLDGKALSKDDVTSLSKLPSLEVVRAQLLGLLNTPAQQAVTIFQAVPKAILTVLQAKADKGNN